MSEGRRRALACLVVGLCGCRPEPANAELVLRFRHVVRDQSIELRHGYETRYGQRISFDHIRYWISNTTLQGDGGDVVEVADPYWLVEQTDERTRLDVSIAVPPGSYGTFAFDIGVDPEPNASLDLMAGELQPGIGMDWDWDTGYKFFRAEGTFEEQETTGRFVMHTGNDVLLKRLSAPLPRPLELDVGDRRELVIEADLDRLFAAIELSKTPEILGGPVDSPAGKVAANYGRMFSLVDDGEVVHMTATSPNLDEPPEDDGIPTDGTPPVLSVPIVDVDVALHCVGVAGDPDSEAHGCMTPFRLRDGGGWEDAGFLSFVTVGGASVVSSSAGIVDRVVYTAHDELTHADVYTVVIRPNEASAFFVEYRGLVNLAVGEAQSVAAGELLGFAAAYHDASIGRVGFALTRRQETTQRLCPTRHATAEVVAAYERALETSRLAWPTVDHGELCETPTLWCASTQRCEVAGDFVAAGGDVEAGRRIYATGCADCHGLHGEGGVAGPLCGRPTCACVACTDQSTLAARIAHDMPPEGECRGWCAEDAAAFILHALGSH